MRRRGFLLGLSPLVVALAGVSASACSCPGAGSPCEALGGAAAVFVGTVTAVREGAREHKPGGVVDFTPRLATFAVEQSFFGVAETAEVATGLGRGDCGYGFKKGTSYLVYAHRGGGGERLYTSACTRTRPSAGAGEDLQYLRGLAAAPSGVTAAGKVGGRYAVDAWANGRDPRQPRVLGRSDSRLTVALTRPEGTLTVVRSILRKWLRAGRPTLR